MVYMSNTSFALLSGFARGATGGVRLRRRFGREFSRYYVGARRRRTRARVDSSVSGSGPSKSLSLDYPILAANLGQEQRVIFRVRWILIGFLLLPVAELVVFLAVAAQIGLPASLFLLLVSSVAGAFLLRGSGWNRQFGAPDVANAAPHAKSNQGLFRTVAGLLLLVPGFLTGVAGLVLLIPAVQRRLVATLLAALRPGTRTADDVVELDPGEWQRLADQDQGGRRENASHSHSCRPATAVLATPPESGGAASRAKEEP